MMNYYVGNNKKEVGLSYHDLKLLEIFLQVVLCRTAVFIPVTEGVKSQEGKVRVVQCYIRHLGHVKSRSQVNRMNSI